MPAIVTPYLTIPFLYLAAAIVGAFFTLNAYRPLARRGVLSISAFFAGWLTSELPVHHLVWQVLATLALVWAGALSAWPGWVALAISVASWAALIAILIEAQRSEAILESALTSAFGDAYAAEIEAAALARMKVPAALLHILRPFALRRPGIERIRNLSYGEYKRRNLLDIVRPIAAGGAESGAEERVARRPVLIWVHGGGWIIGNKSQQGLPLMNYLATLGWVCVAINYRLSPRATFPDQIIDVKRAIAWVKAHIAEYGGDPDFVAIAGGSAGGHLCALAALTANDKELQPGFEGADTSVAACVPLYGIYDFTNRDGVGRADMRGLLERLILKKKFSEDRAAFERASPLYRIHEGAPPFFVIHGVNDILAPVTEARIFVEALRTVSRAKVAYAELPGAHHAFEVFFSVRAGHVIRGVARFLATIYAGYLRRRVERQDTRFVGEGARVESEGARVESEGARIGGEGAHAGSESGRAAAE